MKRALVFCILLVAVAFSFKNLKEPDIWWQLRTGNWILENTAIPNTDPLSFTYENNSWTNIKWGYEVLLAIYEKWAGAAAIPLLQALVSIGIILFLFTLTGKLLQHYHRQQFSFMVYPLLLFGLCMLEFRMTARPEMFSHLFTVVYMLLITLHTIKPTRLVYLIPLLQAVWANMHEGYGVGWVVLLIWIAALWIHSSIHKTEKPMRETAVVALAMLAVCLNPYGVELLWRPVGLLTQLQETKYTTEFLDYTYFQYWQKEAYAALLCSALVIVFLVIAVLKNKEKSRLPLLKRITRDPLLIFFSALVIAFTYLALNALRNVVFLQLITLPLLVAYVPLHIHERYPRLQQYRMIGTLCLSACLYIGVITNRYYEFIGSTQRYGLEISSLNNPEGAATYLQANQLEKEVFSDYMISSYFLWRLQPRYKSYIDLREHEVFPPEFFTEFAASVFYPEVFSSIDSQHTFTAYALYTPQFAPLHRYLYTHPQFRLVYVDAVAAVYVKDTTTTQATYSFAKPVATFGFAPLLSRVLNPFYRNLDYDTTVEWINAAAYFVSVGDAGKALDYVKMGMQSGRYNDMCYVYRAKVHELVASSDTALRVAHSDSAMVCYQQAIALNRENASALQGLAVQYMNRTRMKDAIKLFEQCVRLEPNNKDAYVQLAESYKYVANLNGKKDDLLKAITAYEKAYQLDKKNLYISASLGLLHYSNGNCERAVGLLMPVKDYERIGVNERNMIKQCLINCGVRI
jgi:tetratricopeptide (TPR) repeat protein